MMDRKDELVREEEERVGNLSCCLIRAGSLGGERYVKQNKKKKKIKNKGTKLSGYVCVCVCVGGQIALSVGRSPSKTKTIVSKTKKKYKEVWTDKMSKERD